MDGQVIQLVDHLSSGFCGKPDKGPGLVYIALLQIALVWLFQSKAFFMAIMKSAEKFHK